MSRTTEQLRRHRATQPGSLPRSSVQPSGSAARLRRSTGPGPEGDAAATSSVRYSFGPVYAHSDVGRDAAKAPTPVGFGATVPSGVRALDPAETAILTPVFGSSLTFADIRVSDAVGGGSRPYTVWVPSVGTVINIGPAAYGTPGSNPGLLVHEATHSWQSQHHPSPAAYMGNSIASQAAAGAAGGSSYCYRPGKPFSEYGAEQVANQVEKGVPTIVAHVKGVAAGSWDWDNVWGLSVARWETPGAPGVVC